jgi:hypothetical protein
MPCNPNETLPFYFRAFDPPYMSGEIDPGIPATDTPIPGTSYPGTVSINNDGHSAGSGPNDPPLAKVALWAVQPGTNPATIGANVEGETAIAACSGSAAQATAVTSYQAPNFGSSSHYCLIAKVKNRVQGPGIQGAAADYTPAWDLNNTGDPAAPYLRIAQRNVFIQPGGGGPGTAKAQRMNFAFVIANPFDRELKTQVVARAIDENDERWIRRIRADTQLAKLLEMGPLLTPRTAGIAIGRERVSRTGTFRLFADRIATSLKLERSEVLKAMPRPGELANVGTLTDDQFAELSVRPPRPEQSIGLQELENRQGIVVIEAESERAQPGALFGVDIQHELIERDSAMKPRLLGGLVVFLRSPHPDDPKS